MTSSQQPDTSTRSSVAEAGTPVSESNNVPAKTSTRSESSTVLPTTTVVQQPTALSSIFLISSRQTSISSHTSPGSSGTASSIRTSSTVKELSIVSEARSTANPISSTAWVNTDPSRVSDVQLPTSISSAIISLQSTPSKSLQLPVSVIKSQQSTLDSISSLTVSATTTKQSATKLSMPGTAFFTSSTTRQQDSSSDTSTEVSNIVLPLTQTSWAFSRTVTADAIAITTIVADFSSFSQATATNISSLKSLSPMTEDSASPTSTLTLPTPSGSPTTIAGLPQHSVLSLTSWLKPSYPATIDSSSLATITRLATPTSTISVSQATSLSSLVLSEISLYSTISGSSLGSIPTSEAKNKNNTAIGTEFVQSSSLLIDISTLTFGGSLTISASVTFGDSTLSRIIIPTDSIVATVTGNTSSTASITTMSIRATGLGAHSATENRTVSSSVALSTTSLETSVLPSAGTNGSSPSTVETSSFSSSISASLTQIIISSTTSRTLSTASSIQSVGIPTAPIESDRNITVTSTTASTATTMMSLSSWLHPSLSASLVGSGNISLPSTTRTYTSTGTAAVTESISTSHASRSGSSHMSPAFGSISPSTTTSASFSIPTSASPTSVSYIYTSKSTTISLISTFVTKTRTQSSILSSRTGSLSNDVHKDSTRTPSAVHTSTSSPTETVVAAAAPKLTPSQTAGVALGSTAGVLLAIVAAIFVARRNHAMHAAKHESLGSSGVYPKVAYLYDPSLGDNGGRDSEDDEALAFMSGGASGLLSTGSRTPPRAPQNSFDYDSPNWQYSDPGNPFKDPEDPFLDWRSSDAINSPSETASALAAAVAEYGAGPQKPLPPVPLSLTPLFHDHVIPSPTLSPMVNGCSLRRSHARSSRGSSVRSQRSLRGFHACPPTSPSSTNHPSGLRGPRRSLSSIKEGHVDDPFIDAIEHDLLLPVDVRTETPDSVMVYAPVPRTPMRSALSTILSDDQTSTASLPSIAAAKSLAGAQPRSTGSILFPTSKNDQYSYASFVYNNTLQLSHPDRPNSDQITAQKRCSFFSSSRSPQPTSVPRNKGWEEIKRTSNGTSSLHSPLPTPPLHSFAPPRPNLSPPPPLKKRSLIQLRRKTPLTGTGQLMVSTRNPYPASSTPSAVKASFMFNSNKSFEGPRMSLLAKVNSMGDMRDEAASPKKRKGKGLGYRDSVSRKVEMRSRWSPSEVGRSF